MAIVADDIASGLFFFFPLQIRQDFKKYQFQGLLADPYPQLISRLKVFYLEFNNFNYFFQSYIMVVFNPCYLSPHYKPILRFLGKAEKY